MKITAVTTSIKQWFAPPVFEGDEEITRRASLVNTILNFSIIYLIVAVVGNFLGGRVPAIVTFTDIMIMFIALLLRYWLQRGNLSALSWAVATLAFTVVTLNSVNLGTIRTPTTTAYLFVIILAGELFGLRGILASSIASSLAVLGLILAENAGLLSQPNYAVTITQWITYTGLFGLTGGLSFFEHQTTQKALARAKKEIEAREQVEAVLRENEEKFRNMVEYASSGIILTDEQGLIAEWNPAQENITRIACEEALGQPFWDVQFRSASLERRTTEVYENLKKLTQHMLTSGEIPKHIREQEVPFLRADGIEGSVHTVVFSIKTPRGFRLAGIAHDITERKLAEESLKSANEQLNLRIIEVERLQTELREQTLHDPLTRLHNRRYLEETLAREITRAERENNPLSIIMSDIDFFKMTNDTYGHYVGDKFLIEIASLIKKHARGSDIVCRYGGEEFLLVLPGTTLNSAKERAEEIRQKCAEIIIQQEGKDLKVTMSFGVATYPDHGKEAEEIIIKADKALYQSKHSGRNRVTVWGENQ